MTDEQLIILQAKKIIQLEEELRRQTDFANAVSKYWEGSKKELEDAKKEIQQLKANLNAQTA